MRRNKGFYAITWGVGAPATAKGTAEPQKAAGQTSATAAAAD
jgi:hypothetical protein